MHIQKTLLKCQKAFPKGKDSCGAVVYSCITNPRLVSPRTYFSPAVPYITQREVLHPQNPQYMYYSMLWRQKYGILSPHSHPALEFSAASATHSFCSLLLPHTPSKTLVITLQLDSEYTLAFLHQHIICCSSLSNFRGCPKFNGQYSLGAVSGKCS